MTVAELCLLWSVPHPVYGNVSSTGSTTLRFRGGERLPETVAKVLSKFLPHLQRYAAKYYPKFPDDAAEAYSDFVVYISSKRYLFNAQYDKHTFRSLVFQCYRNKLRDALKRHNRWNERLRLAGELFMSACLSRKSADERAALRCVAIANERFISGNDAENAFLHGVTETDRTTWIAYSSDGLSEAEIGARSNRSLNAVSTRIVKVRQYLLDQTIDLLHG